MAGLHGSVPTDLFIYRPEPHADYGVDASLELLDGDHPTNFRIFVQVKTAGRRDQTGGIKHRINLSTLNYLLVQPAIYVVWGQHEDRLFWETAQELWKHAVTAGRASQKRLTFKFTKELTPQGWQDLYREFKGRADAIKRYSSDPNARVILKSPGQLALEGAAECFLQQVEGVSPPWFFPQRFFVGIVLPQPGAPYWAPRLPGDEWRNSAATLSATFGDPDAWAELDKFGEILKRYEEKTMSWCRWAHAEAMKTTGVTFFSHGLAPGAHSGGAGLTREFLSTALACLARSSSEFLPDAPWPVSDPVYEINLPAVRVEVPTTIGLFHPAWSHLPDEIAKFIKIECPQQSDPFLHPVIALCEIQEEADRVVAAHTALQDGKWVGASVTMEDLFMGYLSAHDRRQKCVAQVRQMVATIQSD